MSTYDRAKLQRLAHAADRQRAVAAALSERSRALGERLRDSTHALAANVQGLIRAHPDLPWGPQSLVATLQSLPSEDLKAAAIDRRAVDEAAILAETLAVARAESNAAQAESAQRDALMEHLEAYVGEHHA